MGWLQRALEFVRGAPSVPDALAAECLEKGYRLARESANAQHGPLALAMAITRGGEIKYHLVVDGNPQTAQNWISEGIAADQYAQVYLFMTLRADDPRAEDQRMLACYMDNPGRGPATLILRPLLVVDGVATLGAMTAEAADVRVAI